MSDTGPHFMEVWRESGLAAEALARRRSTDDGRTVGELRSAIIRQLAPLADGVSYDPEAMALVDAFEAALRDVWERETRLIVDAQARAAVRRSLEALSEGKLL